MKPLPQFSFGEQYEMEDPVDEVTRELSATCELVDELLEAVRARSASPRVEPLRDEDLVDGLIELSFLLGETCSATASCGDELADDPCDPIGTLELLVADVELLVAEARSLALEASTTDPGLACGLHEVAAGLSGSIALMTRIVNWHRPI
jgi:hypothetical protein